jgi:hypothetical protein
VIAFGSDMNILLECLQEMIRIGQELSAMDMPMTGRLQLMGQLIDISAIKVSSNVVSQFWASSQPN